LQPIFGSLSTLNVDPNQEKNLPGWANYADLALASLMNNWYESGSGSWRNLGWWNTANALEAVIDYSFSRSMPSVEEIIWEVYSNRRKDHFGNFINDYYDDEGWWALTWVKAYDRTHEMTFLDAAEKIFEDILTGWDEVVCTGGLWWNKTRAQKNAIENELFITLAARLYLRTNNLSYLTWAERCWNWFDETGMQGPNGLINDGVDLNTCKNNGYPTWTYNQGVILGGLADLYRITGDENYLIRARGIANSAMRLLVDDQGILTEPCESSPGGCGADGPQFKGIFMRYLSYLYRSELEFVQTGPREYAEQEQDFINSCKSFFIRQATSIWNKDRDAVRNTLGLHWGGPYTVADASTQSSALDALNAAIPF
jgi:predicted alpha-1,6-mannanase (GH76 family)